MENTGPGDVQGYCFDHTQLGTTSGFPHLGNQCDSNNDTYLKGPW